MDIAVWKLGGAFCSFALGGIGVGMIFFYIRVIIREGERNIFSSDSARTVSNAGNIRRFDAIKLANVGRHGEYP